MPLAPNFACKNSHECFSQVALTAVRGFAPVDVEPVVVDGGFAGVRCRGARVALIGDVLQCGGEEFVDALLVGQGPRHCRSRKPRGLSTAERIEAMERSKKLPPRAWV